MAVYVNLNDPRFTGDRWAVRFRRPISVEEFSEMCVWLNNDELDGVYAVVSGFTEQNGAGGITIYYNPARPRRFKFNDPNTAFAFKMRWGGR